ncbi:hypothetical protein RvY_16165 [Ramazzottius varieornatus]|uniref:Uncharacterized protein n=1 Tax=Ramazzottius varieornatus TaxID=947166 RepID=A0A1D1W411_RAMVA|nr:hypothetical protein RvY_16165 [Ramazzottius varieornatus]
MSFIVDAPHLLADNVKHTYASTLDLLTVFITELSGRRCSPAQASLKAEDAFEFYNVSRDLSSDVALSKLPLT